LRIAPKKYPEHAWNWPSWKLSCRKMGRKMVYRSIGTSAHFLR
jgi:hypothetical protein